MDGQQRLIALALITRGKIKITRGKQIIEEERCVWFNPETEDFRVTGPMPNTVVDKGWLKLSELFKVQSNAHFTQLRRQIEESRKFSDEAWDRIETLWRQLRHYNVNIHTIHEELDLDQLGDIFIRINFAGTRVKGTDVYSTILAVVEDKAVMQLKEFAEEINQRPEISDSLDYGTFVRTFIAIATDGKVRLASRVLDQAEGLKTRLHELRGQLSQKLKETQQAFESAVNLLVNSPELRLVLHKSEFFPSEVVLVTISYYLHKRELRLSSDDKERRGLLGWFLLASIFNRYSSAVESRLNEDLTAINEGGYKALITNLEQREGEMKERLKQMIEAGNFRPLLLYAFLRLKGAKDLNPHKEQQQEIVAVNASRDHIFPRSQLGGHRLVDDIGNITYITPTSQSQQYKGNNLPEVYFSKLPTEILESHYIPTNQELWRLDKFEQFVIERRRLLSNGVDLLWQQFFGDE